MAEDQGEDDAIEKQPEKKIKRQRRRQRARGPLLQKSKGGVIADISWHDDFIEHLRIGGVIYYACQQTKISRAAAYNHREWFPEFRKAWDEALDNAIDTMEVEARRRAVAGVSKPVYQGGKLVGKMQEYSDGLLMFLLKGRRPNVFSDQSGDLVSLETARMIIVNMVEIVEDEFGAQAAEKLVARLRGQLPIARDPEVLKRRRLEIAYENGEGDTEILSDPYLSALPASQQDLACEIQCLGGGKKDGENPLGRGKNGS